VIDKDFCSFYNYLIKKLVQMLPELENQELNVTWRDEDSDMITITNDEELMVALMEGKKDNLNIYVTKRRGKPILKGDLHYGVTCNACEGAVRGNRYKCLTCPDFDLCLGCEMGGKHNNHKMVRLAKPFEEKTIDEELNLNQPSNRLLNNINEGPVYLLNVPRKKFLVNAEKEVTKRRLLDQQMKELPVYHMKTDPIPEVGKRHRHVMKKVRPATKPLFDRRLPMEEVLKGCVNLWNDFDVEKDIQQKKQNKEKVSPKSTPKTVTPEPNKLADTKSNKQLTEDAQKVQVIGDEQMTESLKQVLVEMFPTSEFHFVNEKSDPNDTAYDISKDDDSSEINKAEKEQVVANQETVHQTDKEEGDRISPVPLTTLAALAALANPEFVSITTTAPLTQSLPSTPVSKSRSDVAEISSTSLPDHIAMVGNPIIMSRVADQSEEEETKNNQTDNKSDVLLTLEAMGLSNDEGWLSKLVEAKQGDIGLILQALTPTKSAERCH